ncbi:MAG: (Fe-S)-binding protein [Proteobacteria bacterium]|nr:(Fe-S)-binding protein [Pseudomonadota bacterium]
MGIIDTSVIKKALDEKLNARLKMYLKICSRCGLCADTCHFYLAHDRDPKQVPAFKVRPLLELVKRKGEVDEAFMKNMYEVAYGDCTMCRRCSLYCPFGIDMASMIGFMRTLCVGQGMVPDALQTSIDSYWEFGNQMSVSDEDWLDTVQWMEEELQEELPGATIPVDKKGAEFMYTVNAREPKFYPMDIQQAARIFHVAGADWTVPSKPGWDSTNLAMFAGDIKAATHVGNLTKQAAIELGVKKVVITECGHAFRNVKYESPVWLGEDHPFEVIHSVELFADYLRTGRIKIIEQGIKEPATYQDPCNVSRNGGCAEEARYLMETICADFRPMTPSGNYNFCCSGGGGAIPMGPPFRHRRITAGKVKAEQIRKTGAKIVVTPCHNCYDQIKDLGAVYELDYKVVNFKELINEILIIPDELKAPEEEGDE